MARMIELMRQSAVPAHIMRAAARGALSLPPAEIIEILVFLAKHPVFGAEARLTLAGWDEGASLTVASDPEAPREVLEYLAAPENRRPRLIPTLLENFSVPEPMLLEMTQSSSRELITMLLASGRVKRSPNLLRRLAQNPNLTAAEVEQVKSALGALGEELADSGADLAELAELTKYMREHAAEIAAEEGKPFELVGSLVEQEEAEPGAAVVTSERVAAAAAKAKPQERERLTALQKISGLTVGERVQLAMKGNKDERFILIRDGCKVVSAAVLESPKISDAEMELFASMKNVQESVLRGIAGKRKFMKNYAVVRALANNPRCPLDLSLGLIPHLLVNDLKHLSLNKNVPDTLRKLADKMFREKSGPKKKSE
jgi:hypothetical protein